MRAFHHRTLCMSRKIYLSIKKIPLRRAPLRPHHHPSPATCPITASLLCKSKMRERIPEAHPIPRRHIMATAPVSQVLNRGGAFLITSCRPEDVFTPADFSDDQRLIGQTAEEFVQKEVMPAVPELEAHKDEHLMAQMLKKGGEIGLLGGGIPEAYGGSGLDKISAAILAEKLAGSGSFAGSHRGHFGVGPVPSVSCGTEDQKKKYLPKTPPGELLSCYSLSEPQAGSDSVAS